MLWRTTTCGIRFLLKCRFRSRSSLRRGKSKSWLRTSVTPACASARKDFTPSSRWSPWITPAACAISKSPGTSTRSRRSEEHTSELQSPDHLVCRLLLEKKKNKIHKGDHYIISKDNHISTILCINQLAVY